MKTLEKKIIFIIVLSMTIGTLIIRNIKTANVASNITSRNSAEVGVILNNFYNPYNLHLMKNFQDIQRESNNNMRFTFFDGKSNPAIESELVNNMIKDRYDLIVLGIVDKKEPKLVEELIYNAKQKNIPLIFFNINPAISDLIKSYPKAIAINTDSIQAGNLQGKMITEAWNTDKKSIDKDGDNIMEYIMLKGQSESFATTERAEQSIATINDAGIKTKELSATSANWDIDLAENVMESLLLKYGNKIEVILANSDSMAIGAIKALQKYGYNMGDKTKTIPVYGIGGIPEAEELIKKGFMAGSVYQNPREVVDAIYSVGMNLVSGKAPIEGTNYKLDRTGTIIYIPFKENITQK